MISILIPVYNFDVTELATELNRQCMDLGMPFEILCYDDGSKPDFKTQNQTITLEFVTYKELDKNHGRARIRNLMASESKYNFLIFIDCDMGVCSSAFIKNYLDHYDKGAIVGGITYSARPPEEKQQYLRWYYGISRESNSAGSRKEKPYASFMSGNFAISKEFFEMVQFDEKLDGYGHEDTLFGLELKTKRIPIVHIDNFLLHNGIDTAEDFLNKTENAVNNLARLIMDNKIGNNDVRLYQIWRRVKMWGGDWLLRTFFHIRKKSIVENLKSNNPTLKNLDLYKLGLLSVKLNEG